jgi:tubulin beta
MKEVVTVHVGQVGVQLAELIYNQNIPSVHYDNDVPRAVLFASDTCTTIHKIKQSKIFRDDCVHITNHSSCGSFATGMYTTGYEEYETVLESIRKQAENCDSIDCLQVYHSLEGGTGSGTASLIQSKILEEFPSNVLTSVTMFPPRNTENVIVPYNVLLGLMGFLYNNSMTICVDSQILDYQLRRQQPTRQDHYRLTAQAITTLLGIDTSWRKLSQQIVYDCYKNLASLHIATPAETMPEFINSLFRYNTKGVYEDDLPWKIASAAAVVRSYQPAHARDLLLYARKDTHKDLFDDNIPDSLYTCATSGEPSGVMIASGTGVASTLQYWEQRFHALFRRKAFLYGMCNSYYARGSGIEELEFTEAQEMAKDLIERYKASVGLTNIPEP